MVELGCCIGRCKTLQKMLFVKDWFMCGHLLCYNPAIKFKHCIKCGNNKWRYVMNNIEDNEVVMNHTILKTTYRYCIKI